MFAIIHLPLFYFGPFLEESSGSGAQSPYAPLGSPTCLALRFAWQKKPFTPPLRQAATPPNDQTLKKSSDEKR
jgi:hypothetical protein